MGLLIRGAVIILDLDMRVSHAIRGRGGIHVASSNLLFAEVAGDGMGWVIFMSAREKVMYF